MGPFEQLASFVVLIKAHGWGPLRETLRSYATKVVPVDGRKDVASLQSIFVERYGQAAKSNVADYFALLGYKVSDATRTVLKDYPAFKPALPVSVK